MEGTTILVTVQISQGGTTTAIPVAVSPNVSAEKVEKSQLVAQRTIDAFQKGQKFVIVNGAKLSKKIVKKLLTEALPDLTIKVLKFGKLVVLALV